MSFTIMHLAIYAFVIIFLTVDVTGHGAMVIPNSWFDHQQWITTPDGSKFDYVGMKSGLQCYSGCDIPPADLCPGRIGGCNVPGISPGCACMWFTNYTFIDKPTLFDPKLRTYPHTGYSMLHNPWRAPGAAYIDSPCGVGGGNIRGCAGGYCPGGYSRGQKAEDFHFRFEAKVTNWTRGSVVEAAWGIFANHGGGYSYRLCKVPEAGLYELTEECFQRTPLNFVGTTQWVQYGEDKSTREEFNAVRTQSGTYPPGSQWTKNPIPACNSGSGGIFNPTTDCPNGTQFPPPKPELYGYGFLFKLPKKRFAWSIIDKIYIPKDLEPGNYVLSFRWDCEQTPQVWNTCASIALE